MRSCIFPSIFDVLLFDHGSLGALFLDVLITSVAPDFNVKL
jgi:hypothetical protein